MCKIVFIIILMSVFFSSCKQHKSVISSTAAITEENTTARSTLKKKYALKLDVSESEIKNEKLYQFIDEWYGTPYKYAGKDKKGIDCSSLAFLLYLQVYDKKISSSSKVLFEETKKINRDEIKEGDLLFFKIESDNVSHVGVYLQHDKFIHSSTKKGVMISDLNEPYFKKYFFSANRVK